jgi:hypothetical protein
VRQSSELCRRLRVVRRSEAARSRKRRRSLGSECSGDPFAGVGAGRVVCGVIAGRVDLLKFAGQAVDNESAEGAARRLR